MSTKYSTTVSGDLEARLAELARLNPDATNAAMLRELLSDALGIGLDMAQRCLKIGYRPPAVPPTPPRTIELLVPTVNYLAPSDQRGIWYSPDAGVTWTLKNTGLPSNRVWVWVTVDPHNPDHWVALGNTNQTGTNIYTFDFNTTTGAILMQGTTDAAIWETTDNGATWAAHPTAWRVTHDPAAVSGDPFTTATIRRLHWSLETAGVWYAAGSINRTSALANAVYVGGTFMGFLTRLLLHVHSSAGIEATPLPLSTSGSTTSRQRNASYVGAAVVSGERLAVQVSDLINTGYTLYGYLDASGEPTWTNVPEGTNGYVEGVYEAEVAGGPGVMGATGGKNLLRVLDYTTGNWGGGGTLVGGSLTSTQTVWVFGDRIDPGASGSGGEPLTTGLGLIVVPGTKTVSVDMTTQTVLSGTESIKMGHVRADRQTRTIVGVVQYNDSANTLYVYDGTTLATVPGPGNQAQATFTMIEPIVRGGSSSIPGDTTGGTGSGTGGTGGTSSPTITSATSISGVVGTKLSYSITSSITADTWTATPLAPGLSLLAGGVVEGVPTAAGTTAMQVTAKDSIGGAQASAIVQVVIAPQGTPPDPPPVIVAPASTFTPTANLTGEVGRFMAGLRSGSAVSGVPSRENTDRYDWKDLETAPGVYNFAAVDSDIDADWAAGRRREIRFRWMHSKTNTTRFYPSDLPGETVAGAYWLHIRNSTVQTRWRALHQAFKDHLVATGRWDKVSRITATAGGQWGEGYYISGLSANATPDATTMQTFATMYTDVYGAAKLVSMTDQVEFLDALLQASPLIGWRRDSLGIKTEFEKFLAKHSAANQALILNRWKTAPVIGEWYGSPMDSTFLDQGKIDIDLYHITSIQNGNIPFTLSTDQANKLKQLGAAVGARMRIGKLEVSSLAAGGDAVFTASIFNDGNAPKYDRHTLRYHLRSTPTGADVWTVDGPDISGILPTGSTPAIRQVTGTGLPAAGTYYLVVSAVSDTLPNDRLTMSGYQAADDSYLLGTAVIA